MYPDYELNKLESLRNHRKILEEVKSLVRDIDPKSKLMFFGSVLKGAYNASSDIDLIIIPSEMKFKDQITIAIWQQVDAPIELHIITDEQFENWYLKFIDRYEEL